MFFKTSEPSTLTGATAVYPYRISLLLKVILFVLVYV